MAKKAARQLATELAQAEARIASMKHAGDSVVLAFAQLKASYVALVRTAREKNITQELGGTTALMGTAEAMQHLVDMARLEGGFELPKLPE
jgi:hypothetical protein